jgi:maleylacetoacetate isomerase
MEIFTYFRSTASYRVRLALSYKNLAYKPHYINLRTNEQNQQYKETNPFGLVPTLTTEQGIIFQSLAIIEYLERTHPTPSLWLNNPFLQAQAMSIAQAICCDIHPLNNLRILKYLERNLGLSEEQKTDWYQHWIHEGFKPLEKQLSQMARNFCIGDNLSIADICLVPQVYNANRFNVNLSAYPTIKRVNEYVLAQPWIRTTTPEEQEDAI